MTSLQRITTEYSDAEDRIRLTGENAQGQAAVLWLTQRLLTKLIVHLCKWVEQQSGQAPMPEIRQEFAQQQARAELAPQPPVHAEPNIEGVLIHSVDLNTSSAIMGMQFKDAQSNVVASLQLQPIALRQWLNIVYDQYHRAQWPTNMWPEWVIEAKTTQTPDRSVMFH